MKVEFTKIYVDEEIKTKVMEVLDSGRYVKGENLEKFEKEFANFCGAKYTIGLNSGTSAILLSLKSLQIGKGDEVIVPSHTFIASASPIKFLEATPVYADVNSETYTIDPSDVEKKVTERTKAIIGVHLYGHPCDMDYIKEIAEGQDLYVIEDACQAHGGEYKGRIVGSIGDIGCFSFFPSKNITVLGDGGMVTTNNEEIADKIAKLRDHGRTQKYVHEILGLNLRMSEIPAAIGSIQLKHLNEFIKGRRRAAKKYGDVLDGLEVIIPTEEEWAKHAYHLYVIRAKRRDELVEHLKKNGVEVGIHYPIPVHKQPCMHSAVKLPVTERIVNEIISLPLHPWLKDEEIEYVGEVIGGFV